MFGYIYITTNIINDRIYIGQHKSKSHDKTYLGSGTILKQAIEKYGREIFSNEILLECNNKEELDKAEKYFIKHYRNLGYNMYNLAAGGEGVHSELASKLAKERWSKTSKEDRVKHMSTARKAYFEKYPRGIIDVMENHICSECGSPTNTHKKECSHFKIIGVCSECGGQRGNHFTTCSKYEKRTLTEAHKQKLSIVAKNRPHCPECGSQGSVHRKGCSKYKPPKTYTCEVCGRAIKSKGNLTQHMAAHKRRGEC